MTMPQTRHYEMKDSGVGSVGNIPKHWRATSLKRALWAIKDGTHGTYERVASGKMLLSAKNVFDDGIHIGNSESLISEESFNEVISSGFPKKGDVLMCIVGTIGRACVYEKNEPMAFQRSVAFLRPNELITSQFLKYTLQSPSTIEEEELGSNGTAQIGLYLGAVQKLPVILPPLSEQTAIAAYLDEKCATIDAIIAEAKASIEEYKSWKASVIFETVTKGLNPNAEMKDSGVEWIGRVSKGWKIVPAKFFMRVQAGYPFDSERFDNSQGIPLIRIRDITSGHTETFYNGDYPEEYVVHNNDLLVGMDGDFNVRWWQGGEAVLNQRCCRIFARKGLLLRYFYFLLPFYLKQVNELAYSTTVKHLANGDIGNADICLPPEDEQTAIAAYLDSKCAAIDGIILEKEELIKELENYRRSLIFEVVTGKRRVC